MNSKANQFKRLVMLRGTTLEAVASFLQIDRSTLYRKIRFGTDSLTLADAMKISVFLSLSIDEILEIFWHRPPIKKQYFTASSDVSDRSQPFDRWL